MTAKHCVYIPPRDRRQTYLTVGGIGLVVVSALVSAIPGLRPAVLGPAVLGPPTAPETVLAAPASPPRGGRGTWAIRPRPGPCPGGVR